MLPSGAHVKIGDHEFFIQEDANSRVEPYEHFFEPLFPDRQDIAGRPGRQNIRSDLIPWGMDDWTGGEGYDTFDPEDPVTYASGRANTRRPKRLAAPPLRLESTLDQDQSQSADVFMGAAARRLWVGTGQNMYHSLTGESFTKVPVNDVGPNQRIADVTGVALDGAFVLLRRPGDGNQPGSIRRFRPTGQQVFRGTNDIGKSVLGYIAGTGKLYRFTGNNLWEMDTTASLPVGQTLVYSAGVDAVLNPYLGATSADDNSLIFFTANRGQTIVHQFKGNSGRVIWRPPLGFEAHAIAATTQGVVILVGAPGVTIYALPLSTLQPQFILTIRDDDHGLEATSCEAGPGNSVLIGTNHGEVFSYDMGHNSISLLDEVAPFGGVGNIGDVITFGGHRYAGVVDSSYDPLEESTPDSGAAETKIFRWDRDHSPGKGSFELIGPRWDLDLPEVEKVLLHVDVVTQPMTEDQMVAISYQLDEDGTWHNLFIEDDEGHTFSRIPVSVPGNTKKFHTLRLAITGDAGEDPNAPDVLSVTAWSTVTEQVELWELTLRLYDEDQEQLRPAGRADRAEVIRAKLLELARRGEPVKFVNGYGSRDPGKSEEHDVILERPRDHIVHDTQGTMRVRLRSVS